MTDKYVIGMGFGDEGKGVVTDYLCSQDNTKLVIRFSGGQQAGHTVYSNKVKHVFSNFGSGSFRGNPTVWLNTCTVDPLGIINEYTELLHKGVKPRLFIHRDCPVTTPFEKRVNRILNDLNGHGSVGVGVGQTWQREEDHYHLTFEDLFYPRVLRDKLWNIKNYYLKKYPNFSLNWYDEIDKFQKQIQELIHYMSYPKTIEMYGISSSVLTETDGGNIYEGSQGLLLDPKIGFFPHVTRSNLFDHIFTNKHSKDIYLVTRAYLTRHGAGPMCCDGFEHKIKVNLDETNIDNYQGNFRTNYLNVDLLQYALEKSKINDLNFNPKTNIYLVITCLDQIIDKWSFIYKDTLKTFDSEEEFVENIVKILNINRNFVLLNNSPYSETIRKFV